MPRNCWASELGGCSPKLSGEHIFSKGLFSDEHVTVEGFSWCKEPRRIGIGALTANVLCTTHNNLLSEVDNEATVFFRCLRESARLSGVRGRLRQKRWNAKRVRVSGVVLERWFLKTLINLRFCHPDEFSWPAEPVAETGKIPASWVRRAFGEEPLPERVGLYSAARVGAPVYLSDTVAFSPLTNGGQLMAGLLEFRGLQFVMSLVPMKEGTTVPWSEDERWCHAQLTYHQAQIEFKAGAYRSSLIDIDW